jgi:hypothetical protein
MRAHTITTMTRPRRTAHHVVLALALGVCALAVPASAYADPPSYRSPEAVISAAESTTGSPASVPATVAGSPAKTADGFDWGSARWARGPRWLSSRSAVPGASRFAGARQCRLQPPR